MSHRFQPHVLPAAGERRTNPAMDEYFSRIADHRVRPVAGERRMHPTGPIAICWHCRVIAIPYVFGKHETSVVPSDSATLSWVCSCFAYEFVPNSSNSEGRSRRRASATTVVAAVRPVSRWNRHDAWRKKSTPTISGTTRTLQGKAKVNFRDRRKWAVRVYVLLMMVQDNGCRTFPTPEEPTCR